MEEKTNTDASVRSDDPAAGGIAEDMVTVNKTSAVEKKRSLGEAAVRENGSAIESTNVAAGGIAEDMVTGNKTSVAEKRRSLGGIAAGETSAAEKKRGLGEATVRENGLAIESTNVAAGEVADDMVTVNKTSAAEKKRSLGGIVAGETSAAEKVGVGKYEKMRSVVDELIAELCAERRIKVPTDVPESKKFRVYRALVNTRPAEPASERLLRLEDEYLAELKAKKSIVGIKDMTPVRPGLYLWQGDITALEVDAIVNAANEEMLGCFQPNHGCVDNAIHTFAGIRLRLECAEIMRREIETGCEEESASRAIVTHGFDLPAKYVLHTVGPIVWEEVTAQDDHDLAACYRACLEKATEYSMRSVAFCCISTGEFGFPNRRAAKIAIKTVEKFRSEVLSAPEVIFVTFKDLDFEIYSRLLAK